MNDPRDRAPEDAFGVFVTEITEHAKKMAAYFDALVAEGMTRGEALRMTAGLQATMFGQELGDE